MDSHLVKSIWSKVHQEPETPIDTTFILLLSCKVFYYPPQCSRKLIQSELSKTSTTFLRLGRLKFNLREFDLLLFCLKLNLLLWLWFVDITTLFFISSSFQKNLLRFWSWSILEINFFIDFDRLFYDFIVNQLVRILVRIVNTKQRVFISFDAFLE